MPLNILRMYRTRSQTVLYGAEVRGSKRVTCTGVDAEAKRAIAHSAQFNASRHDRCELLLETESTFETSPCPRNGKQAKTRVLRAKGWEHGTFLPINTRTRLHFHYQRPFLILLIETIFSFPRVSFGSLFPSIRRPDLRPQPWILCHISCLGLHLQQYPVRYRLL